MVTANQKLLYKEAMYDMINRNDVYAISVLTYSSIEFQR